MSNSRAVTQMRTQQETVTKTTQNQRANHCQVGPATPTILFPANHRSPPHLPLPCSSPRPALSTPPPPTLSPPLLETVFKQKNAVVCSEGCACRLMPTPGFSRRPVLFLALISGCWKFGNRCLKPCKDFRLQTLGRKVERDRPSFPPLSPCLAVPPLQLLCSRTDYRNNTVNSAVKVHSTDMHIHNRKQTLTAERNPSLFFTS